MKWDKNKLGYSDSEEFKYMDYIDEAYNLASSIKCKITDIDKFAYGDIMNCREANRIDLDGIIKALQVVEEELENIIDKN